MFQIREVTEPDDKCSITKLIMHALPEWFSPPDDIERKANIHRTLPFIVAYHEANPIGFLAIKLHNSQTADIFNLGVLKEHHHTGVGTALLAFTERYLVRRHFLYLTVKTLDSSAEYEPYERTRLFYRKMGFTALEVFPTLWNEENPCLFLAKKLRPNVQMIGTAFLPVDPATGKILISRRSSEKVHFPGKWEILGGNLESDESFEECVCREVKEEVNCNISKYRHLHTRVLTLEGSLYITASYIGQIDGEPKANEAEISELRWIEESDLDRLDFCPGDTEILRLGFSAITAKSVS